MALFSRSPLYYQILCYFLCANILTSTSPSIYVVFPFVTASDGCGLVGDSIINLTLSFAPGELSTLGKPPASFLSTFYPDDAGIGPDLAEAAGPPAVTRSFDPADMPCGPMSGSNYFQYHTALSYEPVFALPQKLRNLRPDWDRCVEDGWDGQDPPFALTPAENLDPFISTRVDSATQTTAAAPQSPIAPVPLNTGSAISSAAVSDYKDPGLPADSTPLGDTTRSTDPADPIQTVSLSHSLGPPPAPFSPSPQLDPTLKSTYSRVQSSPISSTASGIYTSLSPAATLTMRTTSLALDPETKSVPIITLDGSMVIVNPQGEFIIGTQTLIPGALPISVSGTPVSLASLGSALIIGTSTFFFSPSSTIGPDPQTIAGTALTANLASDSILHGTQTITPGGLMSTVLGDSAPIIDTSTIRLTLIHGLIP